MNNDEIGALVRSCDVSLVVEEISYFLRLLIEDAKSEGMVPCLKSEFVEAWEELKIRKDRPSLLLLLEKAPEYSDMVIQYMQSCSPGNSTYEYHQYKKAAAQANAEE